MLNPQPHATNPHDKNKSTNLRFDIYLLAPADSPAVNIKSEIGRFGVIVRVGGSADAACPLTTSRAKAEGPSRDARVEGRQHHACWLQGYLAHKKLLPTGTL